MKRFVYLVFFIRLLTSSFTEDLQDLVFVEGGDFSSYSLNENDYKIELPSFWIGTYEVTVAEWRSFIQSTKMPFDWERNSRLSMGYGGSKVELKDKWPIFNVNWIEAVKYCNWLSEKYGYEPVYNIIPGTEHITVRWDQTKNGFRLPTEIEWEYAAKGAGNDGTYQYSGSDELNEVAWYMDNAETPKRVGTKESNSLGIFDMSGNVSEWCWDYYDNSYIIHDNDHLTGPGEGNAPGVFELPGRDEYARVFRGGAWVGFDFMCQTEYRMGNHYSFRGPVGLRVVLDRKE